MGHIKNMFKILVIIIVGTAIGSVAEKLHPGSGIFIATCVPVGIYEWFIVKD